MKRDFNTAVEVGGWLARTATGRGLSREMAAALARMAFEVLDYKRLQGICDVDNHPSIAAMSRLGFTHEGTRRQLADGARCDEMIWSLLADEWPASPAAQLAASCEAFDALGTRLF
jgi:RimJ/RimL family protein N-acetyltransferase